jgi:AcrR family transcriptional regulator
VARPSRQREIVRHAARLFTLRGFHGTSIDDIATATGMSKGAPYHHFGSKSDILYEIYSTVIDHILNRIEKHAPDLSPGERIRQVFSDMFSIIEEIPVEVTVYLQEGPLLDGCMPRRQVKELRARESQFTDYVVEAVEDGIKRGEIRPMDPSLTALALIGMVSWASRWYRANGRASAEQIADLFFSIAQQGYQPQAE